MWNRKKMHSYIQKFHYTFIFTCPTCNIMIMCYDCVVQIWICSLFNYSRSAMPWQPLTSTFASWWQIVDRKYHLKVIKCVLVSFFLLSIINCISIWFQKSRDTGTPYLSQHWPCDCDVIVWQMQHLFVFLQWMSVLCDDIIAKEGNFLRKTFNKLISFKSFSLCNKWVCLWKGIQMSVLSLCIHRPVCLFAICLTLLPYAAKSQ